MRSGMVPAEPSLPLAGNDDGMHQSHAKDDTPSGQQKEPLTA